MRSSLLLFLAACAAPMTTPDGMLPPPTLLLEGPATIAVGEQLSLTVSGALLPNEQVYFARGTGVGGGPCLPFAGGLCIDIENPEVLGSARANANGEATLELTVPDVVPVGIDVGLQALVVRGLNGSNSEYTNALLLETTAEIEGCTDASAPNFDPDATVDDGSCAAWSCPGGVCVETFVQVDAGEPQVDLLLVLDTSNSMDGISGTLAVQSPFLQAELDALTSDWHVGIITADMVDPAHRGRMVDIISSNDLAPGLFLAGSLDQGALGNEDERVFDAVLAALTPPLSGTANAGFRRPGAYLSVGVFSDDDDMSAMTVPDFVSDLEDAAGGPVTYNAFSPPETGTDVLGIPFGCGLFSAMGSGNIAPRHVEASDLSGGLWTNGCGLNATRFFGRLLPTNVAAGLQISFELSCPPANPAIEVRVDGSLVPFDANNGWSYDPAGRAIQFHGSEIPPLGAEVEITYPASAACP